MRVWICLLLALPLIISCSSESDWRFDLKYSGDLTAMASSYEAMSGASISKSVSAIQIYASDNRGHDFTGLGDLNDNNRVFETHDREKITQIILSAQVEVNDQIDCLSTSDCNLYYIFAFDHILMRYGLFFAQECKDGEEAYFKILGFKL